MMPSPHVLVISTKADVATDDVVRRLTRCGVGFTRLNTEDYPFANTFSHCPGVDPWRPWLSCQGRRVPAPTSVWYRRLRTPPKPDGMDEGVAAFCLQETRAALVGSVIGRDTRWMSHPTAVWQAEYKLLQLTIASRLGLSTPRTVVTNDPETVRSAFHEFGSLIVKPVRSGHVVENGVEHAIFTSRVLEEHLGDLESTRWSPAIYQELVPKRYDVRATFVGGQCFAAAIDSQTDPAAIIDWRRTENPALPHHRITLPSETVEGLRSLLRELRLTFGAIDLVQTPSGEYVFLEVNPSGQWLWLDDQLELGISDAVTNWLTKGDS
jgi:glutathione synthase/RimK-type ligase-like ATP-grasp enzyme